MRIMCVLVSLMLFLVLSSGCSEAEEKRERAKLKVRGVEPEAKRAKFKCKKAESERKKAELRARKVKALRKKARAEKLEYIFLTIKNIQKRLLKHLGLTHLKEEQARELFKKLMPLIRRMHPLEKQAQELELRADVLMEQGQVEEATTLRFKAIALEILLEPLKEQVRVLRATYRKKQHDMRVTP